jgi:hypothetical protein
MPQHDAHTMRPNIDVPWQLHGEIKEYSELQNISIEESYLKLLEAGLDATPITEEHSLRRSIYNKTTFIPRSNSKHAAVCTFHPYTLSGSVAFRTGDTTQSLDQVEQILAELQRFAGLDTDRGVFTVQQNNGAWIGRSLSTYFDTLGNQDTRYESLPDDFSLETHHSEAAFFVSSVRGGSAVAPQGLSTISVSAQPTVDGEAVNHFQISLATNGIPLDPQKIAEFGNRIGMSVGNGQQREPLHISVPHNDCTELEIEPVQRITEENHRQEWVTSLICENPFYQKPDELTRYLQKGTDSNRRLTIFEDYIIPNKHIRFNLEHHHPAEQQPEYVAQTLDLDDLNKIGGSGIGTINLYFAGTYLD